MKPMNAEVVLDNLLSHMLGHIYWKDKSLRYLGCNDKQAQSLGLQEGKEVIGKTDFELWPVEVASRFSENDRSVIETGRPKVIEEQAKINGKPATMLSLKAPMKDSHGQITGILGISIDISQEKEAQAKLIEAKEAAEAADKAKTEFLENMRHDIRTPLAGIIGAADLIKKNVGDSSETEEIKILANHLVTSGNALSSLLNEVLEIITVASGNIPLQKKKFNLQEKLLHIIKLNQCKADQKNLKLTLKYDQAIPCYLVGDAMRIQRLVLELVTNALNFTETGHVIVTAELASKRKKSVVIKIKVEDTGVGIEPDKQQAIFTRFKRLTPSYEGIYKGAGLGLAIVKQFVDELGAEIYVESKPQAGSIFTCVLPLKKALLDESYGADQTLIDITDSQDSPDLDLSNKKMHHLPLANFYGSESSQAAKKSIRILLVEDDRIAAQVTEVLIKKFNCTLDIAKDGKSALKQIEDYIYDVIFLDIGLPDMSGIEVAKKIHNDERSQNKQTPTLALTAHGDAKNREEYLQAGIKTVLIKPLLQDNLRHILSTLGLIPDKS